MSVWSTGPAVFGRPRAIFLRFAPWAIFQNNHPHDLMWPVSHLYGKGIAEACGWEATVVGTLVLMMSMVMEGGM